MPDMLSVGLLSIAGNLLGSLNKSRPSDDFEALKIIDENDPIRLTLEAIKKSPSLDVEILMQNGSLLKLNAILEIGYGAALMDVVFETTAPIYAEYSNDPRKERQTFLDQRINVKNRTICTIRYSAIAAVHQVTERK